MSLEVRPRPEVAADLAALPDDDLRRIALGIIVSLAERPYQGRSLRGNICDCRKVYFDYPDVTEKPAYRVVYRLVPDERNPVEVDVVTVGERAELEVYRKAARRLGR